jgi:dimethylargininase
MLNAITRQVSPSINKCELTHLERQPIDFELARKQHEKYEEALRSLGMKIISLPVEADLPDSVFVEDTAIILDEIGVITRPGADSRRPEIPSVAAALSRFRKMDYLKEPATLDGGDVLVISKTVYVGISSRSNPKALTQLQHILNPYGYSIKKVEISGCLHLKSAITRVAEDTLLINPKWVDKKDFPGMGFLDIDPSEPLAANALLIDKAVIYPNSFPKTCARLESAGIRVIPVDVSELTKAEGAVTCCSLVFNTSA